MPQIDEAPQPPRRLTERSQEAGLKVSTTMLMSADVVEALAERVAEILGGQAAPENLESPYLSIREASDYLRCSSRQRVDDLLSQGRLTRVKDGSRTLLLREELRRYLAGERTGPSALGAKKLSAPRGVALRRAA